MATVDWTGASGKKYTYHVHDLNFDPNPNQDGNYIFEKVVNSVWNAVYVGEGDLKERIAAAKRDGCVTRKAATHIHAHLNGSEKNRKAEEADILAGNPEAYEPTGCNKKTGG